MKAHEVVDVLRGVYGPPAYAFMEQVGNATGYSTTRHADAIAMGLWPSRGLHLSGFEVKVDRADWRRELARPDKAEPVAERCDFWFVVAPAGIVPLEDLPHSWGLLEVNVKGRLVTSKRAEPLEAKPLDRAFLAALLRQAAKQSPTLQMRSDARAEAQAEADQRLESRVEQHTYTLRNKLEDIEKRVHDFEETTGIPLENHAGDYYGYPSGEAFGKALNLLARGGAEKLSWQVNQLENVRKSIGDVLGQLREVVEDDDPFEV